MNTARLVAPHYETQVVLEQVASRWAVAVLAALEGRGILRYIEIQATVGGIPQRKLVATLRALEGDGFLSRTRHGGFPPRVDYELTPLGRGLAIELRSLCSWLQRARTAA